MTTLIVVLIFVTVLIAVFALAAAFLAPADVLAARLQALLGRQASAQQKPAARERLQQILEPLSRAVPKSPAEVSSTRLWLMQAGYREPRHLNTYFAIRMLAALGTVILLFVLGAAGRLPVLLILAPALAYFLPRFQLKRTIRSRQQRIQLALPDALDLAIVCVEAGLGLDQALDRVGSELRHTHRDLSEELNLVTLEMRAGKPRAEALRNLALRTGVEDIQAFVAVLVQTDKFGTSVAAALRVHSDALRTERRQRAEERAAKTTIKMIPVLVCFIFPVMFFVILGPVVISVLRDVVPAVKH